MLCKLKGKQHRTWSLTNKRIAFLPVRFTVRVNLVRFVVLVFYDDDVRSCSMVFHARASSSDLSAVAIGSFGSVGCTMLTLL